MNRFSFKVKDISQLGRSGLVHVEGRIRNLIQQKYGISSKSLTKNLEEVG